jgi:hypothetical protein
MNAKDLELKISGLEKVIQEKTADASRFQDELKVTQKQLEDINKPEITPLQFDLIQEAIERGVDEYDFSDTDNFDIEYGIEYDGKVHCESHELSDSGELVEMITSRVYKLFTEAECPEEDDNSQLNNATHVEKVI